MALTVSIIIGGRLNDTVSPVKPFIKSGLFDQYFKWSHDPMTRRTTAFSEKNVEEGMWLLCEILVSLTNKMHSDNIGTCWSPFCRSNIKQWLDCVCMYVVAVWEPGGGGGGVLSEEFSSTEPLQPQTSPVCQYQHHRPPPGNSDGFPNENSYTHFCHPCLLSSIFSTLFLFLLLKEVNYFSHLHLIFFVSYN